MSLLTIFSVAPNLQVASTAIGGVGNDTITVTFAFSVIAEDYSDGISIEVAGAPAVISSATRQADHKVVKFVLSAPVGGGENVEIIYDASAGTYSKEDLLIDFDIQSAATGNQVGMTLWFDQTYSSGHIVTLGL